VNAGGGGFVRWRVRAGYPLALAVFWLARPTLDSIAWGGAIGALGLFVRGLAAGHLRKHEALAVTGPYAYTRNPLYFGSAVLAAGLALACRSWIAAGLVAAYFVVFYIPVMRREEQELRKLYGVAFEQYAKRVPLFFPALNRSTETGVGARPFSWPQYVRNREYQAAVGFVLVLAALCLLWRWRGE
jgi:protein-S-isoprenylcysteine O-methyltransferase Ste14